MCGIAGLVDLGGLGSGDVELAHAMVQTLAHRGPDDHGVLHDRHAAVGARRLAVIDLTTGNQPLTNEDGSIWVAQNGEIYRYLELREELLERGHVFRTDGDTETIVHAYEEFGDAFVERLEGMFAISIWDARRCRLVLARDRIGKKPLYWRLAHGRLTWGSELKALLADPSTPRAIDRQALADYLQLQYIPSPMTILEGVWKLPPASILTWDGGEPRIERYWNLPPVHPVRPAGADIRELRALLEDAVRIRLRSDVPVGAFLSGGVDSSIVTALMVGASPAPVRTFTIGFTESDHDELPYARAVARYLGTDHTEDVVTIDAAALLPTLAHHFDEPMADASALPTFRVAEVAGRSLKVVLTGDGGDESFGGYTRYLKHERVRRLQETPGSRAAIGMMRSVTALAAPTSLLRRRAAIWSDLVAQSPDDLYVSLVSITRRSTVHELLGTSSEAQTAHASAYLLGMLEDGRALGPERLLRTDLMSYLPEGVLVKVDRATMANALEARSPLLDHRVIEFAASLPHERKIAGGRAKVILRELAATLLPPGILDRPKMGFGIPLDTWFDGALGDRYTELVLAPDAAVRGLLDVSVARRLLVEHRAGSHRSGHTLWSLLMLEQWCRTWLPGGTPEVGQVAGLVGTPSCR